MVISDEIDMISEDDKSVIEELALRYEVKRILLFGSAADPNAPHKISIWA